MRNAIPSLTPLLRPEAVLAELGVSRRQLDRWRSRGIAPRFIRLPNGDIRMRRETLDAWVNDGIPHPLPTLSLNQAARELRVTTAELTAWIKAGKIPGVPKDLPETGRIRREVIDAWLADLPAE